MSLRHHKIVQIVLIGIAFVLYTVGFKLLTWPLFFGGGAFVAYGLEALITGRLWVQRQVTVSRDYSETATGGTARLLGGVLLVIGFALMGVALFAITQPEAFDSWLRATFG